MEDIKDLLKRYINGQCSSVEVTLLRDYISGLPPSEQEVLLQDVWNLSPEKFDSELKSVIWNDIESKIQTRKPYLWKRIMPYAAAILLLIGLYFFSNRFFSGDQISNKLTLLENSNSGPKFLVLPDSSLVWLNSESSISYRYSDTNRVAIIHGEAFFEISKDSSRVFSVWANDVEIKVLGTSFNLDNSDSVVSVALVTGKVDLNIPQHVKKESITLSPGQKADYNKTTQKVNIDSFYPVAETAWKYDHIILDGSNIHEVVAILQNLFPIAIEIKDSDQLKAVPVHKIKKAEKNPLKVMQDISEVTDYYFEQIGKNQFVVKPK